MKVLLTGSAGFIGSAIDRALTGKKKFKSVADMIDAIYLQQRPEA